MPKEVAWKSPCNLFWHKLSLGWEKLGYFQCQADVACDFKRAAKESALRVKFALRHFQPVLVGEIEGHVRLLDATFNQLTGTISYFEGIDAGFIASNVPLERFVHV